MSSPFSASATGTDSDDDDAVHSSSSRVRTQKRRRRGRIGTAEGEQQVGLLAADSQAAGPPASPSSSRHGALAGLRSALGDSPSSSSSSRSGSEARRPPPPAASAAAGVPFAALSGGDESPAPARPVPKRGNRSIPAVRVDESIPSPSRHGDRHLPAATPPPFLQLPSSPPASASAPVFADGASFLGGAPNLDSSDAYSTGVLWRLRLSELFSLSAWRYYFSHSLRELNKRRCNYCLGLFSCFLVVVVASVCFTLIARAPVVFLQQAETEASQIDLMLSPVDGGSGSVGGGPFLNYTRLMENVGPAQEFALSTPRSTFYVYVLPASSCPATLNHSDPDWKYVGFFDETTPTCNKGTLWCLESLCPSIPARYRTQDAPFTTIDTAREKSMGLGRLWLHEPLEEGEVLITPDLAQGWGLRAGDEFNVRFSINGMEDLNTHFHPDDDVHAMGSLLHGGVARAIEQVDGGGLAQRMDGNTSLLLDSTLRWYSRVVYVPFRVRSVLRKAFAKFPSDNDALIVAEQRHFLPYVLRHVHPLLRKVKDVNEMAQIMTPWSRFFPGLDQAVDRSTRPEEQWVLPEASLVSFLPATQLDSMDSFATHVAFNMPERVERYLETNYDVIQEHVLRWAARVLYRAGLSQVASDLPVLGELSGTKMFSLYLGLILSVILTILCLLSTLLIYSLLLMSIDSRTFELGVHRMVGASRGSLVKLLLTQALSFSIPAWSVGLIVAQVVAAVIVGKLEDSVEVPLSPWLTRQSIGVGSVMGLAIPLLASILPIRSALGHNLQSALDTRHSKTVGVKFNIERSEDAGISGAWMALGVGTAVIGFLVYYLMPLALLSFNLALLLNIFFALLLGMLLGLILLSLSLQPLLERFLVFTCLFWEARFLRSLVLKNLTGHRVRNRKTAVMFALSLGFILFITAQFQLEMFTAKARSYKWQGADIVFSTRGRDGLYLQADSVAQLEDILSAHSPRAVTQWSWVSSRLKASSAGGANGEGREWDDTFMSNLGHAYAGDTEVYGVSPNFFSTAFADYLVQEENTPSESASDVAEQLYTPRGSQSAILASSTRKQFGLGDAADPQVNFLYALQRRASEDAAASLQFHRMRPLTYLDVSPRFNMGRFPTTRSQASVVSFPTFQRLANNMYPRLQDIPMSAVLMRTNKSASKRELDALVRALKDWATGHGDSGSFRTWDLRDASASLDQSNAVMALLFSVATYLAIFLCLFSLVASMLSNILEQAKEIAVLRALGLTRLQVVRLFTYEAFVLVMAASMLGLAIGFVMSAIMVAQRILITQLSVPLNFPVNVLAYTFTGSVLCAMVASWLPARQLMRQSIASIMKSVL